MSIKTIIEEIKWKIYLEIFKRGPLVCDLTDTEVIKFVEDAGYDIKDVVGKDND